jgi:hypothetical protein
VIQKRLILVKGNADTLRNPITNIAKDLKHIEVRAGKTKTYDKKSKDYGSNC